jgi:hypothetical protein
MKTKKEKTCPPGKKETRIQKEILRLTALYKEYWQKWTTSNHCFLAIEEVRLIELLRIHGKQIIVSEILKIPPYKISTEYLRIKRKLISYHRHYTQWKNEILPANFRGGKNKRIDKRAEFLNAPFYSRHFPNYLENFFRCSEKICLKF